jgi:hypothetical protein
MASMAENLKDKKLIAQKLAVTPEMHAAIGAKATELGWAKQSVLREAIARFVGIDNPLSPERGFTEKAWGATRQLGKEEG